MDLLIATCDTLPELDPDERLLLPALQELGVDAVVRSWTSEEWPAPVLLRTTWDYHEHLDRFLPWIDGLDTVWNPASIVHWNAVKTYLRDLPAIVPTQWLDGPSALDFGWDRLVLKPVVGATASGATVLPPGPQAQAHLERLLQDHPLVLCQPFVPAVVEEGEWSAIFIDGTLSHGVLKKAARGDWRVQEEWGGSVEAVTLPAAAVAAAERALGAVDDVLYARVDLVRYRDSFVIIELELIEPALYLRCHAQAPAQLAAAVARRL